MKIRVFLTVILSLCLSQAAFSVEPPAAPDTAYTKFRVGSYGEVLAQFMDYGLNRFYGGGNKSYGGTGTKREHHNAISIPRFVLGGEYKITPKWILGAEIEFEAGGTGQAVEIEATTASENGEYETEFGKGGEVNLEQFHITFLAHRAFNIRAGHLVLPVGLTNSHHEPLNYFTAARPEGATKLLPSTWHETGLEFFGEFGKGLAKFDYEAMITAGLNPNGFNIYNWVKGGKQGLFETDNFTAPAYTARLNWTGVPGLRLGGSIFFNPNAGKNADKLNTYDDVGRINVLLYSFDAQYVNRYVTARANFLTGNITNTVGLTQANNDYSSKSPYSRKGPVARQAIDVSAEVGLNVKSFFPGLKKFPALYPFVHYNYYNTQYRGEPGLSMDKRCEVTLWSFGINYRPLPMLVIKADYTTRQIGTAKVFGKGNYTSENEFRIAVAYNLWFTK